jgi:hypothetical protein
MDKKEIVMVSYAMLDCRYDGSLDYINRSLSKDILASKSNERKMTEDRNWA